ncbi:hypothetical protein H632_c3515p0, partial [Helicosporidium sp. ATCC 50920]
VPTVGDRDPGSVRRMTRYFRSLVDETSVKARFLAGFAKEGVAREGAATGAEAKEEQEEDFEAPVADPTCGGAGEAGACPAFSPRAASLSARQSVRAILDASLLPDAALDGLLARHGDDPERVVDAALSDPKRLQSPPKRPRRAQALAKPGSQTDRTQRSIVSFLSPSAIDGGAGAEVKTGDAGVEEEIGVIGGASGGAMDVEPRPGPPTPPASACAPVPALARRSEASTESMAETIRLLELPPDSFDPGQHACWRAGEPTPYWHVASTLEACTSSSRRLRIGDLLCNCFSAVLALCPEDIWDVTGLVLGRLIGEAGGPFVPGSFPDLGVGHSSVFQAVLAATGSSPAQLRRLCRDLGDMGDAAAQTRSLQTRL